MTNIINIDDHKQDKEGITPIEKISLQKEKNRQEWVKKAEILCEALPYMKKFAGETFVIKFGGSAMGGDKNLKNFAKNVVLLKQVGINPVIVHGGGPQIGEMLKKLNISSSFVDGLRVTDSDTVDVVEMVLAGSINKIIVKEINAAGSKAVGICGKDANLIRAKKITKTKKASDYRNSYLVYLGNNWVREGGGEGMIQMGHVREMRKINEQYWNPRETNFSISVPEADILTPITTVNRIISPFTNTVLYSHPNTPSIGFKFKGGKFSFGN